MTPMMEQYWEIKKQYMDYIVFYRLGDFYEMFFDDAILASRELELTLTGRDCGEAERAPMCGVPFHSYEGYVGRLIEKNYKVAICEQVEDPSLAKGLVRREVIRMITPGTLLESSLLSEQSNNYLCAICMSEFSYGLCFADASTGEVYATSFSGENADARLRAEIGTYSPREAIVNISRTNMGEAGEFLANRQGLALTDNQYARFEYTSARERVLAQFGDQVKDASLDDRAMVSAIGALLSYIEEAEKGDISYIRELNIYSDGQYLEMDINTRRNLELTESMRNKEKKGSLLWVLDKTETAAGARMLKKWVEKPLLNVAAIETRQSAVEELCQSFMLREELGEELSHVLDLERLITRIVYGNANAKDLRAVCNTAVVLPEIKRLLTNAKSDGLRRIYAHLDTLDDVCARIAAAIVENPPFSVREGKMIADGYSEELDALREIMNDGDSWLEKVAEEEREKTGIRTLRIGYNRVFGYYIEVSKSFMDQVPEHYIRKQTLTNGERYITPELKKMEDTIIGAKDRAVALEYELFQHQ